MHRNEALDLFLQPLAEDVTLGAEVNIRRRVLCDLKQPILDTEPRVLEAEIKIRWY